MLGNFKREGKALSNGPLKSLDHDFSTLSDGQIVPHGIYDVIYNYFLSRMYSEGVSLKRSRKSVLK